MFRSEGAEREGRLNRLVAGYLAFIGGYVNSCGFVFLGIFTSHVTGNVGRASLAAATHDLRAGGRAMGLVVAFYLGALGAHLVLDSARFGAHVSRRYGAALACETVLVAACVHESTHVVVLSAAMGLQNSLVTRLSGAIVRTTHLTGVMTDLGIESARWIRHWRRPLANERPSPAKIGLLGTIAASFSLGAIVGSWLALGFGRSAFAAPSLFLALGALYARAAQREG